MQARRHDALTLNECSNGCSEKLATSFGNFVDERQPSLFVQNLCNEDPSEVHPLGIFASFQSRGCPEGLELGLRKRA